MDLDVLFLGTAGAVPTAQRGPAAYLVRRGGERILVDCGEGTQRQMLRSTAGLADIDLALITHFHADHVLGLPGMLKTFALRAREAPLTIHGPAGLRALIGSLDVVGPGRRLLEQLVDQQGMGAFEQVTQAELFFDRAKQAVVAIAQSRA